MYSLRKAGTNDIGLIQELCLQVWPQTYASIISPEQITFMLDMMYSTESLTKQISTGIDFWILYDADIAIGYASLEETGNKIFKLHKLYVSLQHQKKGAGSFIISELINYVAEKNGISIELQVNRTNKAVEFYKKQGFYIVKEANFDIGNGFYMNDYIMQKDVTFAAN